MRRTIHSLIVGTLFTALAATGVIAADKQAKEKASKEAPAKEKPAKEAPQKEKATKETTAKDFPNAGRASPEGKTQKERDAFLQKESSEHPNSYKDTKEYKAHPEKQRKVDAAVERDRKALEELRRQQKK